MAYLEVWAPRASGVQLRIDGQDTALSALEGRAGWLGADVPALVHGVDYQLVLDGEALPNPLARSMPAGVNGPSRWWDASTLSWQDGPWDDALWAGRLLDELSCVYELHVGTFTPEGTLDAAIERLEHLLELGVTHIELLPLSAFDGPRGWGYDGVALAAVHEPYGGPDALARFVLAAHARGLAVLLDVVHNHFGPSGNYWDRFGPMLTDAHHTPWGAAVNLDTPGSDDARSILLATATTWLRDFHLDGLRLDAVHELVDNRARTFLEELADTVQELSREVGRPLTLIAESDRNDARTVLSTLETGLGMTAQWDDDVHHALHWLLTGETGGYYRDFGSADSVQHTLERVFLHDGRFSSFRGRTHGRPVDLTRTPAHRFVVALQTHDQVGNRAAGERLSQLVGPDRLAAGAALLLSLPYTPMLFMGEEWGASTPWCFFSSFPDAQLGEAVTNGRRGEFTEHGWDPDSIPDPQSLQTFAMSQLDWTELQKEPHAALLHWYRSLLRVRRELLGDAYTAADPVSVTLAGPADAPTSIVLARGELCTAVNLGSTDIGWEAAGELELLLGWPTAAAAQVAMGTSTVTLPAGATGVFRVRS